MTRVATVKQSKKLIRVSVPTCQPALESWDIWVSSKKGGRDVHCSPKFSDFFFLYFQFYPVFGM